MMSVRRGFSRAAIVAAIALAGLFLGSCQAPGSVLRGRLTTTSGSHVAGIPVTVYSNTSETTVVSTVTDSSGDYSFSADTLAPGTYRILFGTSTWWNGAADWPTATPVVVTSDSATVIDATVDIAAGSVAGTVTDSNGSIAGVAVAALDSTSGSTVAPATTAGDGTYSFSGLPSGSYVFRFSKSGYAIRYNGSAATAEAAPVVSVTDRAAITGIDTTMVTQSTNTGTVTDGTTPLSDIVVGAFNPVTGDVLSHTSTSPDGTFTLTGLDARPYKVAFFDFTGRFRTLVHGSSSTDPTSGTPVTPVDGTIDLGTVDLVALTVPDAPTGVSPTAGNGQATVSWAAPASDGGSTVTGYTFNASSGQTCDTTGATTCTVTGLTNGTSVTFTVTSSGGQTCTTTGATTCTVTGLTKGTSYTFTVTATSAFGTSSASAASAAVIPVGPPDPPTNLQVVVTAPGVITITWDAPLNDAGSPIDHYDVHVNPDPSNPAGGYYAQTTGTSYDTTGVRTPLPTDSPTVISVDAKNAYGWSTEIQVTIIATP